MTLSRIQFLALLPILVGLICQAGCSKRPKLAEVSGRITMGGQPLADIEIKFIPDPEEGNSGRYSIGKTDSEGFYQMEYFDESKKPGVSIGVNRIVLRDLVSAYSGRDDVPIPSRIGQDYSRAATTPLSYEVVAGPQEFNIDLK